MKTAAFFDLDKTILGTTSSLVFTRPLFDQGLIKRADVVRSAYRQFIFTVADADHVQTEKMREYLSALVTGWDVEQLQSIIQDSLDDRITPTVHAEALELIAQHKSAGRDVIIISASGSEIVNPVAQLLGADLAISTELEIFNGKYTGGITFYAYGQNKAIAINELAKREGYDLSRSFAYSDSLTDLPMLEAVGMPHAVNPDSGLREIAIERGWPVLTFEKPAALRRPIIDDPEQRKKAVITVGTIAVFAAWYFKRRSKKNRTVS
jgi:HAD superfamily hydrolase (TIGR01490 family)